MNDKNKEILALLLNNNNNNIFSLFSKQNNAYTVKKYHKNSQYTQFIICLLFS